MLPVNKLLHQRNANVKRGFWSEKHIFERKMCGTAIYGRHGNIKNSNKRQKLSFTDLNVKLLQFSGRIT